MKSLPLLILFPALSLVAVEKVDLKDSELFREQQKELEKPLKPVELLEKQTASLLYRSWVNPVPRVNRPSEQAQKVQRIHPGVQQPQLEPSFSQMKEWRPGKGVQVYEKGKEFDKVLNPLSLRDFNRFIYQRNPSSF